VGLNYETINNKINKFIIDKNIRNWKSSNGLNDKLYEFYNRNYDTQLNLEIYKSHIKFIYPNANGKMFFPRVELYQYTEEQEINNELDKFLKLVIELYTEEISRSSWGY
jgi:hypothetical protein